MAILQALISILSKSASKVLNAIFGWAVLALFGQTSATEQTLLSALVAAAAAWPLLVIGVAFPRAFVLILAFVPLAKSVPVFWLRLAWTVLALAVPIVVGIVVANRAPPDHLANEPAWKKLLRGFPITVALASAFLLMMIIAPIEKLRAIFQGRDVVHVPALVQNGYSQLLIEALSADFAAHGLPVQQAKAPWQMTAPSKILLAIGGDAFSGMVSQRIEYRRGGTLEVTLNPSELVLRGKPWQTVRAHALAAEVFAPRPVLQTFAADAQSLEEQIKRVWSVHDENPRKHDRAQALLGRVEEIAAELAETKLPYDEWQIVYRELLQLDRAVRGHQPLLVKNTEKTSMATNNERKPAPLRLPATGAETKLLKPPGPAVKVLLGAKAAPGAVERLSNRELLGHISESAVLLVKKEVELARTELKADLKAELGMVKGLGVAGLCALFAVNMMLVALALALGHLVPDWAGALIVAAGVLLVGTLAGVIGWGKRVRNPLEATRRTLKEDVQWAKERIA